MPISTIEAFVSPDLLTWARERHNLTVDAAAKKLHLNPEKLREWEGGKSRPSLHQAQQLASKLYLPLGYLFLSTRPKEKLPLPDLRTLRDTTPKQPTPEFLDTIYDALRKQQWYHDYLADRGATSLPFVGRFTVDDHPDTIASDIRQTLKIDDKLRLASKTWEMFLTQLIHRAEDAGVVVLRSSVVSGNTHRKLDVTEFQGFASSDNLAPLIFVNEADYKAAQIFTTAHELAHLWIGQSGISNLDYQKRSSEQLNKIDRQCDSIAAEVLVPGRDFTLRWNDNDSPEVNIQELAIAYRVSAFVVLRRAFEYDKISPSIFHSMYRELIDNTKPRTSGGGDFYSLVLARNSNALTSALVVAASEGSVPPREAASLLNVRIPTLSAIEAFLLSKRWTT